MLALFVTSVGCGDLIDLHHDSGELQSQEDHLIAYYPFEGDASDSSGFDNHGSLVGDPKFISSCEGTQCIELDGNDDAVAFGDIAENDPRQLRSGGTIAAWFNQLSTSDESSRLVDKSLHGDAKNGYMLYVDPRSHTIGLAVNGTFYKSNRRNANGEDHYTFGEWTHVAAVIRATTYELYVDGERIVGTIRGPHKLPPVANTKMRIGSANHTRSRDFKGKIDEVKIFDAPLSPSEVAALSAEPPEPPKPTQPAAQYDFDSNDQIGTEPSPPIQFDRPPEFQKAVHGNAVVFDGDGQAARLNNGQRMPKDSPLQLTTGGTIMAWFKQWDGDDYQRIVDKSDNARGNNGYALFAHPAKGMIFLCVDQNCYNTQAGSYQVGTWTHVAAVIDPGSNPTDMSYRIHINGEQANATLHPGHRFVRPMAVETEMSIGSWNHKTQREFHGLLDDIQIYTFAQATEHIAGVHADGRDLIIEQDLGPILAAHYPLDTNGVNIARAGQNGTKEGPDGELPQFVATGGVLDGHLSLDGNDDALRTGVVDIEDPLQLTKGGTIMAWFKQWDGDDYQRIVDKSDNARGNNGYALFAHPAKGMIFLCVDQNCYNTQAGSYQVGTWTHVAAVIDPGANPTEISYRIYINGDLADAALAPGHEFVRPVTVETEMSIGAWNHKTGRNFHGLLDDIRIYTFAQTAENIERVHAADRALITDRDPGPILAAHYPLDTNGVNIARPGQDGIQEGPNGELPQFVATGGVLDGHLSLDGNDDTLRTGVVDIEDPLQLTRGGTIMVWFKQWDGDDYQRIVDKSNSSRGKDGYALFAHPAEGRVFLCVDKNCYRTQAGSYQVGTWTHVAAVIDPGDNPTDIAYRIYINGEQAADAKLLPGHTFVRPVTAETEMSIGSWNHKAGREFHGLLDDIQIYTFAQTADYIAGVHDEGSALLMRNN